MTKYEYKVLPAPDRGLKARGVKGADGRFAHALEVLMNDMGAEGWEYQRAETLPCEERQGLSGKTTVYRNMLVFRRLRTDDVDAFEPRLLDPPKEIPVLDAARVLAEEETAEGEAADADKAESTYAGKAESTDADWTDGDTSEEALSDDTPADETEVSEADETNTAPEQNETDEPAR